MMHTLRAALVVGAASLMVVCAAKNRAAPGNGQQAAAPAPRSHAPSPLRSEGLHRLDDGDVTPEMRDQAVAVLDEHAGHALGTEVPFEMAGNRYVARIEEHWDEARGPHKGVTLYASEK